MSKVKYYEFNQVLSYNRIVNMVVSPRGNGKSYGAKRLAIRNFLKKGEEFVYVRRLKKELEEINLFFNDMLEEFPDEKFEVKGGKFYINDILAGYAIPLSGAHHFKSVPMPKVTLLIYDEFIIDTSKGSYTRYLKNEVECFLDLVSTVIRDRNNLRCLLLGNNVSLVNPYFSYWNINASLNRRFTISKNGKVILELFSDKVISDRFRNTEYGKLIDGTRYGDYNLDNVSLRDNDTFILKDKPKKSYLYLSFIFQDKEYGVWCCEDDGFFYINNQYNKSSMRRYAVTKQDHAPNLLLLSSLKKNNDIKLLVKMFEMGSVMFNSIETKNDMYDIFSLLSLR